MRKGLELFQTRSNKEGLNILELELKYNIQIPEKYRLFVQLFQLGVDLLSGENSLISEYVFLEKEKVTKRFTTAIYEEDQMFGFIGFYELETCLNVYNDFINERDSIIYEHNFLPIAAIDNQMLLCLGTMGEETDKIFLVDEQAINRVRLISDNIFVFANGFRPRILSWLTYQNTKIDNLYKNWNEDFWRVKT